MDAMRGPITNLKNHLLVATAALNGSPFERAVIYMVHQDRDGAMGFVINHPLPTVHFDDIARSMGIESLLHAALGAGSTRKPFTFPPIFKGGPMETGRGFVLHSPDYKLASTTPVAPGVVVSTQPEIVGDIAQGRGPQHINFCLGFSSWAPGQLEAELHTNGWLVAPSTEEILFHTDPAARYDAANMALGLNALNFHDEIGRA